MTVFRDEEGNERIQPSTRAMEARDAWLKAHPHYKEVMREQLTGPARWTNAELDAAVARWKRITGDYGDGLATGRLEGERMARRRARQHRRAVILAMLMSLAGVALAVVAIVIVLRRH